MTDGYKIKRVLIWQNNVEKQIYPAGWKPGANTLMYLPLKEDVNDHGPNSVSISSNPLSSYITFSNDVTHIANPNSNGKYITYNPGNIDTGLTAITFNVWVKTEANSGNHSLIFSRFGTLKLDGGKVQFEHRGNSTFTISYGTSIYNTWTNICVTRNGSSVILYVNGTQVASSNSGGGQLQSIFCLFGWPDNVVNWTTVGYFSELIYEKGAWTSSKILDYYNSTKLNYGL